MGVWHETAGFSTDHHLLCTEIYLPAMRGNVKGLHGKSKTTHAHLLGKMSLPNVKSGNKQKWEQYTAAMGRAQATDATTAVKVREAAAKVESEGAAGSPQKAGESLTELLEAMHAHVGAVGVQVMGSKGKRKLRGEGLPGYLKHLLEVKSRVTAVMRLHAAHGVDPRTLDACRGLRRVVVSGAGGERERPPHAAAATGATRRWQPTYPGRCARGRAA